MAVISPQDVYNYLLRFSDSWAQMEDALNKFVGQRAITDYKRLGNHIEITMDNHRGALRVPMAPAHATEAAQEPASAPALNPSDLAEADPPQEPDKPRAKRGRPPKKAVEDPIKLTIHGVEVNYRSHIRGLVSHIICKFDMAEGDLLTEDWIKEISEGA